MLGWAGVLNFSMVTIACLYIAMGFFGYLRYGAETAASITLNLPQSPLAEMALGMFSVAIFFSYALQFYVVMDIIGPNLIRPHTSDAAFPWVEQAVRVLLNVITREYSPAQPILAPPSPAQPSSVTERLLNFGPAPCHEYDPVTRFAQCSLTDDEVELLLLIRTIQSLFVVILRI